MKVKMKYELNTLFRKFTSDIEVEADTMDDLKDLLRHVSNIKLTVE